MILSAGINVYRWDIPLPLHAPDGFFSLPLAIVGYAIAALVIAFAIHRTNRELNERMVPMMGVMAAFIFAAQMINFPVAGGTSGHLVGAALAAIILGPWAAILVMTAVVGLQALMFQDGGLVVLGINLINMSIVGVLAGYGAYRLARKIGSSFRHILFVGGFVGAWVSVMVAAVLAAFELALSGTSPLSSRASRAVRRTCADRNRRGADNRLRALIHQSGPTGAAPSADSASYPACGRSMT